MAFARAAVEYSRLFFALAFKTVDMTFNETALNCSTVNLMDCALEPFDTSRFDQNEAKHSRGTTRRNNSASIKVNWVATKSGT